MTEPRRDPSSEELASWHRTFAPQAFNHTWKLLDAPELTTEQELEMLAATFAQRFHWYEVGDARNRAIADWQVSRVFAVLGYAELSKRFGEHSLALADEHDLGPFVKGFAYEAIARAAAEVDDVSMYTENMELARTQLEKIEDEEEREALTSDLAQMSEG